MNNPVTRQDLPILLWGGSPVILPKGTALELVGDQYAVARPEDIMGPYDPKYRLSFVPIAEVVEG